MTSTDTTSADLQQVLERYWGYTSFRPLQREAMDAAAGSRRLAAAVACALAVLAAGSFFTWLLVPLPRGSGTRATRTPWSAALGLFAAIPMVYFMFLVISIVRPLFG